MTYKVKIGRFKRTLLLRSAPRLSIFKETLMNIKKGDLATIEGGEVADYGIATVELLTVKMERTEKVLILTKVEFDYLFESIQ